ncbi:hypothetical protein L6471_00960 [Segatella bryantii]|uniref:hypothetical protein n=1 Tax=Segatella bryantii TaxID=77095 RepID=UPI001EDAEF31|nr:hypothetical protein [Segatella bryantii]UKK75086.1 hypothetical protein L6471_00960 [Segatella bryantii]
MDRISDKRKCMASLTVFRNLYNQKRDIYCVIAEFIKLAIAEKALSSFDLQEMVNIINQEYGFDLPVAVVKRALGKLDFLNKNKSSYTIKKDAVFNADEIRKDTQTENDVNQKAIDSLCVFVEGKMGKSLSIHEKEELCNDFCTFIIDDTNSSQFGEYISQFIIEQSNDKAFVEQLNQIRQGVVIFVGLNYNADYNAVDKLDTQLHIYLDTEIIFHMFGLNGALYKDLFDEFYELVQEVNKKAKTPIIKLRYFAENRDEIESYFKIAERIVRKEEQLNPSKQAMSNIVNGCIDASQVVEKKSKLFRMLAEKDITLDTQEHYYDKETNWNYLIDSKPFYEYNDNDTSEKDIDRKVKLLNYISIKRGYKSQSIFRTVGHILLSANKVTFTIAFDKNVKKDNCVPLATSLSFLTNRFWMVLNKGLSNMSTLRSINVITKAQIALSSRINDNVGRLFSQFIEEDKQGKFDIDSKKATLAELHKSTVSPDDLHADNADSYVEVLSVNDINAFIAERKLVEAKNKEEHQNTLKKMKEQHDADLKERAKKDASLRKAALEIQDKRNREYQNEYEKQKEDYFKGKATFIKKNGRKDWRKNAVIATVHVLIVIGLFVVSIFNENNKIKSLSISISFIIYIIPFVRPLWDHRKVSKAYKYIFFPSYRKQKNIEYENEYRDNNPKPMLKHISIEEVLQELMN